MIQLRRSLYLSWWAFYFVLAFPAWFVLVGHLIHVVGFASFHLSTLSFLTFCCLFSSCENKNEEGHSLVSVMSRCSAIAAVLSTALAFSSMLSCTSDFWNDYGAEGRLTLVTYSILFVSTLIGSLLVCKRDSEERLPT